MRERYFGPWHHAPHEAIKTFSNCSSKRGDGSSLPMKCVSDAPPSSTAMLRTADADFLLTIDAMVSLV